jgi:hypothetical protein
MKASELIKNLAEAIEKNGDLEVRVYFQRKSHSIDLVTTAGRYYLDRISRENWIPYHTLIWVDEEEK